MVEIEIIGNIGREDEIKNIQRENGANALRFSIAGTTGRGEKQKTSWYTCFYNCDPKFRDYLHQGMKVFIRGEYSDSLYVNPRTQSTAIDRTISVHKLEFCESKQQSQQTQPQQVHATLPPSPYPTAHPVQASPAQAEPEYDENGKPLPF